MPPYSLINIMGLKISNIINSQGTSSSSWTYIWHDHAQVIII